MQNKNTAGDRIGSSAVFLCLVQKVRLGVFATLRSATPLFIAEIMPRMEAR